MSVWEELIRPSNEVGFDPEIFFDAENFVIDSKDARKKLAYFIYARAWWRGIYIWARGEISS